MAKCCINIFLLTLLLFSLSITAVIEFSRSELPIIAESGFPVLKCVWGLQKSTIGLAHEKQGSNLTLSVHPKNVTVGSSIFINGTVTPKRFGANITLESRVFGGTWTMLVTVMTDVNGYYSYNWRTTEMDVFQIRARCIAGEDNVQVESDIKIVKVEAKPVDIFLYVIAAVAIVIIAVALFIYFMKMRKHHVTGFIF